MPAGPTPAYRMELASTALVCGLVAFTLFIVIMVVLWRTGRRGPYLLFPTALGVISLGLSAAAAVLLGGLARGTDTTGWMLGIEFGSTAIALALILIGLAIWRRDDIGSLIARGKSPDSHAASARRRLAPLWRYLTLHGRRTKNERDADACRANAPL